MRWASTGADRAGAFVAGFDTAEPELSRTGFVPGAAFSGFGTLFTVGLAAGGNFP